MSEPVPANWVDLRHFTPARVGLGRAGNGIPTTPHLTFQAAHAAARDAVHAGLDVPMLRSALLREPGIEATAVQSAATDRRIFLMRPDLGRRLPPGEAARLAPVPGCVAVVICDGLSATGIQRHAPGLLSLLMPALLSRGLQSPVIVASQGRVALGDEIGEVLQAEAVVVLIGERPGLSAADSLSAYLTWAPRRGRTDAERNCISNIRPEGFPLEPAVRKILWLLDAMRQRRLSGVDLKDEQPPELEEAPSATADGTKSPDDYRLPVPDEGARAAGEA